MAGSWFWVWMKGVPVSHARRRKAESVEQAACLGAENLAAPGSRTWTFCVQRCGIESVYEVEVKQTVHLTATVVGPGGEVGR